MSKITSAQIAAQQAWQNASYGTGWVNFDVGGANLYGGIQYMKDTLGFVHIRGLAKNTGGSTLGLGATVFTLPSGYRPYENTRIAVVNNDNWGQIEIKADGTVNLAANTSVVNNSWISLSQGYFMAEN